MDIAIPPRVIGEVARMGRAVSVAILAALCGLGVLGCLLAGLWIAVLPHVGPAGAPLVVAATLAIVAVAAIATLQRSAPPPGPPPANDDIAQLLDLASHMTRTDKVPMLLAALLVKQRAKLSRFRG